jgi:arylsulfatase A-like enzyme
VRLSRLVPLALTASLAACGPAAPLEPPRHVVVIVLDATHGAHLSCQGGPAGLTPNLDALAERGARFPRAFSNAAWTLPSTASLMTGRWPEHHGVVTDEQALPEEALLLAERFRSAGWRTGAFVQMVYASDAFGLHQGFDDYRFYAAAVEKQDPLMVVDATSWMDAHAGERTLLYLHFRRPHGPYNPSAEAWRSQGPPPDLPPPERFAVLEQADALVSDASELTPSEQALVTRLYRANLATVDAALEPILRRARRSEDTLVVVTADHGEALGQHGPFGHGHHVWAEMIDIPLIVAGPGIAPTVDETAVCTVDLLPTLLEACRLPVDPADPLDGRSFWPRLLGRSTPADRAPIPVVARYTPEGSPPLAIIDGRWKLLLRADGSTALYDRASDPGDLRPLDDPERATQLADLARDWRERHRDAPHAVGAEPVLDERMRAELEQLGYVR